MRTRHFVLTLIGLSLVAGAGASALAHHPMPPRAGVDVALMCDGSPCDERVHGGTRYVVGELGQRYTIALSNRSAQWVEAVVTVDGRSVLDGQRASTRSRGYLLPPHDRIEVEGWRTSSSHVAAFRFTSVADSYAGRVGDAALAGTIRVDVYPERRATVWVPPREPVFTLDDDEGARDKRDPAPRSEGAATSEARRWHDGDGGRHLGTQYGESRWQPVAERSFERADPHHPSSTVLLRYDDYAGLVARGIIPGRWVEDRRWVPPPPDRRIWIDDGDRWVPPPPR